MKLRVPVFPRLRGNEEKIIFPLLIIVLTLFIPPPGSIDILLKTSFFLSLILFIFSHVIRRPLRLRWLSFAPPAVLLFRLFSAPCSSFHSAALLL